MADLDRQATARYGIPALVLMEHAGHGLARLVAQLLPKAAQTLVLCGPGNNGGDGYALARFLASWGRPVRLLRCSPPHGQGSPEAGLEAVLAGSSSTPEPAWEEPRRVREALTAGPALVVDALFGVGLTRALAPPYLDWITQIRAAHLPVLAVDVPSGLDADSGEERPLALVATVTATMGLPKPALALRPDLCGRVIEVDIGWPLALHAPHALAAQ